jgi:glycosyltransferase involved in cell wall biosynthesis
VSVKVLQVVPTYTPAWRHGGPIGAVHGLAKALVEQGHEVTVYTTNVHGDEVLQVPVGQPVDIDGVDVRYFGVSWPRRLYRSPGMGHALARGVRGFDVVHVHSVFLWPGFAVARSAGRACVPYLVSPHGMLVRELVRRRGRWRKLIWLHLVERRNLAGAAGIHVASLLEWADIKEFGLPLPRVVEVPFGVDTEPFGPDEEARISTSVRAILDRPPFVLYLGRINWKKGLDRLIAALAHCPGARLVVAGNDEEAYRAVLERMALESGVAERIVFPGPVLGADKAALLHRASALVLPSYSENFGVVVVEAMAAGCPVVVTPQVGLAPTVEEVGAGVVTDGDPLVLGKALRELLADPERRVEMGRNGIRAVGDRFAWPVVARRMAAAYQELIGPPPNPAAVRKERPATGRGAP